MKILILKFVNFAGQIWTHPRENHFFFLICLKILKYVYMNYVPPTGMIVVEMKKCYLRVNSAMYQNCPTMVKIAPP